MEHQSLIVKIYVITPLPLTTLLSFLISLRQFTIHQTLTVNMFPSLEGPLFSPLSNFQLMTQHQFLVVTFSFVPHYMFPFLSLCVYI